MSESQDDTPSAAESGTTLPEPALPASEADAEADTEADTEAEGLAALRRDLWLALGAFVVIILVVASVWILGMQRLTPREPRAKEAEGPAAQPTASQAPATAPGELSVIKVKELGADDPDDPLWDRASATAVAFQPQTMTAPQMPDVSLKEATLKAASDGERIAFRVTWKDPSADANVDVRRFCDAVAIGFPIDPNAPPMMGAKGLKMQILYWKALWQKDIDEHFQDVQDLHPNFWSDLYWFAQGEFPYPIPGSFKDPRSRQWFPAQQAKNPMADFEREQPVQELLAEGWGTLTPQKESATTARGRWQDGRWSVVFSRPLKTDDPLDAPMGAEGKVALAVWNGFAGNRGARKQWAGWVPFKVETQEAGPPPRKLKVHPVSVLPKDDPTAPAWAEAPSLSIVMAAQKMTRPQQATRSIPYVRVRALTDGQRLSVRVNWRDPKPDWHVDVGRFCDGVAIGFPLDPSTPPMMGAKGFKMQILYWKALWQKDVDEGFQDVQDLYPNFWSDLYWFAEGKFPYPIRSGSFRRAESRLWFPAQQAGNPVSIFDRTQPVQELLAEGWGTLTHQKISVSTGRGTYVNGTWSVVFTRPLRTDDPQDAQLGSNSKTRKIAFAVWDGAAADRGARKNWSANWVDFEIEVSE